MGKRAKVASLVTIAVVAVTAFALFASMLLQPHADTISEGSRWAGSLDFAGKQSTMIWPEFGQNSNHSGTIQGVGPLQGQVAWSVKTGGPVISSPVAGDGIVYAASGDSYLYAAREQDGHILWRFPLGPKLVNGTPALAGSLLLVAGDFTWLNALDARSGQRIWRFNSGDNLLAPPAIDTKMPAVFVSSGGSLLSLDLRAGTRRWEVQITDNTTALWPSVASPAVANGTVIWAPGIGSRLFAVSESDGAARWNFDTHDRLASTPVISGTTVYISTWHGGLHALDVATGAHLWQRTLGHAQPGEGSESTPAVEGKRLFIGSYESILYALDASTGIDLWQFRAGGPIVSSPATSRGVIYCASEDGNLYAVDAETGKLSWKLRLGEMRASPALTNGGLYIGTLIDNLISVR